MSVTLSKTEARIIAQEILEFDKYSMFESVTISRLESGELDVTITETFNPIDRYCFIVGLDNIAERYNPDQIMRDSRES